MLPVLSRMASVTGLGEVTATVWLQTLVLPHGSVASQVRVRNCGSVPLVTVARTLSVTLVPLHASKAAGKSKLHGQAELTVLLAAHVSAGGMVSATVTVWLQELLLPAASTAIQVRVMTCGQRPLVTVATMLIGT